MATEPHEQNADPRPTPPYEFVDAVLDAWGFVEMEQRTPYWIGHAEEAVLAVLGVIDEREHARRTAEAAGGG